MVVMRVLVLLPLLVAPAVAQTGTWTKLPPGPTPAPPGRYYCTGPNTCTATSYRATAHPRAYSSLIYGNVGGRGTFFIQGGGHGDHSGNDVELYDIPSNTWTQQFAPEAIAECCPLTGDSDCDNAPCVVVPSQPTPHPACAPNGCSPDSIGSPPYCFPGSCGIMAALYDSYRFTYPYGRPFVAHSYQCTAFDPVRQLFVWIDNRAGVAEFDPLRHDWVKSYARTDITGYASGNQGIYRIAIYDPSVGIQLLDGYPQYEDPVIRTWDHTVPALTKHGSFPINFNEIDGAGELWSGGTAYDTRRHRHLVIHNGNKRVGWWWYDATVGTPPNAGSWTDITANVPQELGGLRSSGKIRGANAEGGPASMAYDQDNDLFLVGVAGREYGGDGTHYPLALWVLDPNSNTFTPVTTNTPIPSLPCTSGCNGSWGTLHWDSNTRKFYFMDTGGASGGGGATATSATDMWTFELSLTPAPTNTGTPPTATPTPTITQTPTRTATLAAASLAGYWPLDENSGTTVNDYSGNANHGSANGLSWVTGQVGAALSGAGATGYEVTIPDSVSLSPSAVSVAAWVKTSRLQSGRGVITKGPAGQDYDYMLYFTGTPAVGFYVKGSITTAAAVATTSYADNAWHHYVGVYDGTSVRLYVDGTLAATTTTSAGAVRDTGSSLRMLQGWDGNFEGAVDIVRVYDGALSASDVATLFLTDGGVTPGPTNTPTVTPTRTQTPTITPTRTPCGTGTTWQAGPSRTYKSPCDVAAVVSHCDRVEIDAGTYLGHESCPGAQALWTANGLTIVAVGGPVILDANGNSVWGKAIWVVTGNDTTIDGFTFQCEVYAPIPECTTDVQDNPGAGIRLDGEGLTVRNSVFRYNDNGILTKNGGAGTIDIQTSEFHHNGYGWSPGQQHNIYVAGGDRFIFRGNYSHHALIGHTVKSRARQNYIEYNRIMDEAAGTSSFLLDLPNGGLSYVIGNLMQKGPLGDNNVPVNYAAEGATNPVQELYVVNNTIVNETGGSIPFVRGYGAPAVLVRNNIMYGGGSPLICAGCTSSTTDGNLTNDPFFIDHAAYNYALQAGSPAIGTAVAQGTGNGYSLVPIYAYETPMTLGSRTTADDVGGLEFVRTMPWAPIHLTITPQ